MPAEAGQGEQSQQGTQTKPACFTPKIQTVEEAEVSGTSGCAGLGVPRRSGRWC